MHQLFSYCWLTVIENELKRKDNHNIRLNFQRKIAQKLIALH